MPDWDTCPIGEPNRDATGRLRTGQTWRRELDLDCFIAATATRILGDWMSSAAPLTASQRPNSNAAPAAAIVVAVVIRVTSMPVV